MNKPKVLIIQETLSLYNDPIYQLINKSVELSFAYTLKNEVKSSTYKILQLPYIKCGPFIIHKHLRKIINQYDVVIINPHLKLLKIIALPFISHIPKLISWSIGLHVTYNKKYDLTKRPDFKDKVFQNIQNHCDACIFYMPQPIEFWKKYGEIDERKYFVAHNTVKVADYEELPPIEKRDKFLFVGTLYRQKGIGELIDAYCLAKKRCANLPQLFIIGKGPEKEQIEEIINEKGLGNNIVMVGPIYEEEILKNYFLTSLLCISPKQAGLSVQKSLGYGVPFVTRPDAITGGERFDVLDKKSGFYYQSLEELVDIMVNSVNNPGVIEKMSYFARDYYLNEASPKKMAQGVLDAINFVLKK